ncbi:MAG: MMPL family transporter [Methyloversatilis discipulorum]|uniref:efflux RND transporter permease subunit n=1 Tax=Methyloversatilis discipulorum TaxID=1119528 RepID=UPI0026EF57EA|nr:MMPL family transporter [Methyloversatilis discipulorum]MBV5286107.1 MMPL family transporter [Methyloversatilis discipulorum]
MPTPPHDAVAFDATGRDGFDAQSGSRTERLFFNNRLLVIALCALATLLLGYQATRLQLAASFERMLPTDHPYVENFRTYEKQLAGSGNVLRIVVATEGDSILDPAYMDTLRRINDEVYLLPGVDRAYMKSLYMSAVRWVAVTDQGLDGGPVMPDGFDGSPAKLAELRANIERSGQIGQLVASDFRSSVLQVPLIDRDFNSGKPLDYQELNAKLEELRAKYSSSDIRIHITGFAKVAGDLIDGLRQILVFFAVAIGICSAVLYGYTRCVRSTGLVMACSLVAVVWLLGLLPLLGFELNPYSILVPFLVFAIGMSHGAQKMNGIMQDIGRGAPKWVAARLTFRRLFLAGLTALLADAVGFAVLMIIRIPVIQDLALAASLGVAVLIFTNLVLLPVLLSYTGVSPVAAARSLRAEQAGDGAKHAFWAFLDLFTQRRWATRAVIGAAVLGVAGFVVSLNLKIGDLDPGAPELRADSRYNLDNAYVIGHYAASSDVYTVMIPTPKDSCSKYGTLLRVNELESRLRALPGVESTVSFVGTAKSGMVGFAEGNPKWYELSRDQASINSVTQYAPRETLDAQCSFLTIQTFLKDHKADTLDAVASVVDAFGAEYNGPDAQFLSAAGNAGIEAATNIVVRQANREMLALVYAAVVVLCFVTFRSWRAVVCAVVPLVLTSILCEALMVWLGIGVKVATLPVVALGVGIGVDYALYVLSVTLANLKAGRTLSQAYYGALLFTGKVVVLTGVTLGIAVATWAFSPIKFQGDMGILLAFMFVWNMLGALILLPALAYFLLRRDVQQDAVSKPVAVEHGLAA